MRQYLFQSPLFSGQITLGYNENGILIKFINEAELSEMQLNYFTSHFPFRIDNLDFIKGKSGIITEITDISFEHFWNEYGYKKGKLKAEINYKKLTDGEKLKAIMGIRKYRIYCKLKGIDMVYPERYIKDRRYDDE